jgi:hypothetical protein
VPACVSDSTGRHFRVQARFMQADPESAPLTRR